MKTGSEQRRRLEKIAAQLEKTAMDPLTFGLSALGMHLGSNTLVKGLRAAHSAGIKGLGRILPNVERNAVAGGIQRGLTGAPTPLSHAVVNTWVGPEYLANAPAGEAIGKAFRGQPLGQTAKSLKAVSRELKKIPGVEHTPILGPLQEGTSMAANRSMPGGGLPKAPSTLPERPAWMHAVGPAAIGAALTPVAPDALLHGAINRGRLALAKSETGKKYLRENAFNAAAQEARGEKQTLLQKAKNLGSDFIISPAVRDPGVAAAKLVEYAKTNPHGAARLANTVLRSGTEVVPGARNWIEAGLQAHKGGVPVPFVEHLLEMQRKQAPYMRQ